MRTVIRAGSRRPEAIPIWTELADASEKAGELPEGFSELRLHEGPTVRRAGCPATAEGRGHRAAPGQDPVDDQQRRPGPRTRRRVRVAFGLLLAVRVEQVLSSCSNDPSGIDVPDGVTRIEGDEQGSQEARVDLCRTNDRLCLHASDGARERPHRSVSRARAVHRGRCGNATTTALETSCAPLNTRRVLR